MPEFERWRGQTEAHIQENSRRLDGINGSIGHIENDMTILRVQIANDVGAMKSELSVIRTKVALWSAVGSLGGGAVIAGVVGLVFK